ncbi:transcriptional enhancer factor TEF-1-like isoform X2 [Amphibalanus amphitrite]|nr:transcriptional enhancer factor TEF-1-like isoform X2 [Amphibalanus amphitrite]XP_043237044.1 transcriptional enhancer factor TEF-1-like isoform X2 [Amphibalanus amphitrite]XP_043237045.1 transcriptional enhancer factor TEF-1-like isoform X2 [Amphibalanus amphitrite]XP_043247667.1 transcriptional enhancer factor TEF-1-like isoform X2 [Amphibalanus amphitrite]XP_043247668.1 transcriptional enhancer factor TEF-1-like isoform X2 [Amphibalanus amphitrite]XP_043247669.1 transcriptional enhancer 
MAGLGDTPTGPPGLVKDDALKLTGDTGSVTSNEDDYMDDKNGDNNDAEGVWSQDIEQSFHEALSIYPPCGRRKIILSDEGKMYGRNELIARYIKLRTGKCRTRKQVSSHIQVLARRKLREIQTKMKQNSSPLMSLQEHHAKEKALHSVAAMTSAQIVNASNMQHKTLPSFGLPGSNYAGAGGFWQTGLQVGMSQDVKPFAQHPYGMAAKPPSSSADMSLLGQSQPPAPAWEGRSIATQKLRLVEYSAFMEAAPQSREHQAAADVYNKHLFVHIGGPASYEPLEAIGITQIYDKFPDKKGGLRELYDKGPANAFFLVKFWADLNTSIQEASGAFYGVTSQYESPENMTITCSTKVCSFGKQVVEKVETEYARFENGRFFYRINRSPMCEYMVNFIHKLKHLPEKYMMNSVLENFTILQVVTNRDTQETLLCIAFVFEVSTSEHGAQHHIYRLVKD